MSRFRIADVRVFVPARDMDVAKAFYMALGWKVGFESANLALLENGDHRFYLNNQFPKSYPKHFRMHITVDDAQACFDRVSDVVESDARFSAVRIKPPKQQAYGALVTYVYDPSGVLLDLCQWTNQQAAEWAWDRFNRQR